MESVGKCTNRNQHSGEFSKRDKKPEEFTVKRKSPSAFCGGVEGWGSAVAAHEEHHQHAGAGVGADDGSHITGDDFLHTVLFL